MHELYATAAAWRKQLTPEEWNALHVVMIGPHMPREQECSVQFFERLFHEPHEGKRIIYAEALWNEKDALDLLATHVVDEAAGGAFLWRPHAHAPRSARRRRQDLPGCTSIGAVAYSRVDGSHEEKDGFYSAGTTSPSPGARNRFASSPCWRV